jgi:predicted Abi (CAAX) family protease
LLILSTILLRLWVALVIPPSVQDLFITWLLFFGYCLITIPAGLLHTLVNFEPIQVWWNLELYRDGLRLHHNRQALKVMVLLWLWVLIEELIFRACLLPLAFENLPVATRIAWIAGAGLLAIARYLVGYRHWHPLFKQLRFFKLAVLLEIACSAAYLLTESLWMSILLHWLLVVVWLVPLGGRYQLQQYKIFNMHQANPKTYIKD